MNSDIADKEIEIISSNLGILMSDLSSRLPSGDYKISYLRGMTHEFFDNLVEKGVISDYKICISRKKRMVVTSLIHSTGNRYKFSMTMTGNNI